MIIKLKKKFNNIRIQAILPVDLLCFDLLNLFCNRG